MSYKETDIVNTIMVDSSKFGARLFRNVRGGAYPVAVIKPLIASILNCEWQTARTLCRSLRMMMFGLQAPGASDLIGGVPVVVTQEMVGKTIAVFTAIEVKTADGRPSPEQLHFIDFVQKFGGYAGIARSPEEAKKIMKIDVDTRHEVP